MIVVEKAADLLQLASQKGPPAPAAAVRPLATGAGVE